MHTFAVNEMPATALWEYLSAAKLSLEFKKPSDWGNQAGYPLGFAAALLLFCIVDAIGSHHRGSHDVFNIDGKYTRIKKTDHHFFVLNAPQYYGQSLCSTDIHTLYAYYRSALAHNAAMPAGNQLRCDVADPRLFFPVNGRLAVNLPAFHHRSIAALQAFQHA